MGKKTQKHNGLTIHTIALLSVLVIAMSCKPNVGGNLRGKVSASSSASAVAVTQGRVLKDNPIILVLASKEYSAKDYIRDYSEFVKLARK